ncbi:hypothetical protein DCS32_11085 [Dokdonia sp. Dokd-P16]|uniref:hypothetical protein n=1 Tax=Dokdonia sp. Dokd-P16 TaxID=2173169 RepID=UPI000D5459CB|nr:hypothetical protein [Dokdonia sp. Dokd-P16]AWH74680.1 hypothetical protein DCS32_11085 [Dokdonia sp. Dokd-P16]
MANTLENIKLKEESISINDKHMDKLLLFSNLSTSLFLLLYTYKSFNITDVDMLTIITGLLGGLLLVLSLLSIFRNSWQKEIDLSEIDYVQDKTAFTGHRSLILRLKNKKIKNLYLEPADIPEMLRQLTQHNIPINAKG